VPVADDIAPPTDGPLSFLAKTEVRPEAGRHPEGAHTARDAIASGALRGPALLELVLSMPVRDRDVWVDELLGLDEAPPDVVDLPRGSVPYLPAAVDEIVAMIAEVPVQADDEFVDIGSGLGRAAVLAHLLSGARARGVEIQEPLVRDARARAAALNLTGVTFVHASAADVVPDGSVFFLYAPCNGEMLTAVLHHVEAIARRRPIVVCALGLEFRDVTWLRPRKTSSVSLAVYDSHVPGVPCRPEPTVSR
jgi:SAM-dependent methyltransferase